MKVLTKSILCVGALALTYAPSTVWAATACSDGVPGALAVWVSTPGFSCSIGDKTFSNFTYSASGTNPIAVGSVLVDTIGPAGTGASLVAGAGNLAGLPAGDIGLQFSAPWTAGSGQNSDSLIGFTVTVTPAGAATIEDASLLQGGSGIVPPGIASIAENLAGVANLLTLQQGQTSALLASTTFTPTGSVNVTKDINVNALSGGFASISQAVDVFSQVPIPGALPLFATGLVGLWGLRRRRSNQAAA